MTRTTEIVNVSFRNLTTKKALAWAEYSWGMLTDREKKERTAFYVLESVNPDEDAEDHFDGDPIKVFK